MTPQAGYPAAGFHTGNASCQEHWLPLEGAFLLYLLHFMLQEYNTYSMNKKVGMK